MWKRKYENCRPTSVLLGFSNVLDRIMYNSLDEFFTSNNLPHEDQFDLQIINSTEHASMHYYSLHLIWPKTSIVVNLNYVSLLTFRRLLIKSITKSYWKILWLWWENIVFSPKLSISKKNNTLKLIMTLYIYLRRIVVSHSGLYFDQYYF